MIKLKNTGIIICSFTQERYARPITNSFVTSDFSANEKRCIQCLQISCAYIVTFATRNFCRYNV